MEKWGLIVFISYFIFENWHADAPRKEKKSGIDYSKLA